MTSFTEPKRYFGLDVLVLANIVTIIRIFLTPVIVVMILRRNPSWYSLAIMLVAAATDKLDGQLARKSEPTKLGAFLDTVADKIFVLAIGFALVHVNAFLLIPMVIIAFREIGLTIYRTFWAKKGLAMPARQSGKYKTALQIIAIGFAMTPILVDFAILVDITLWLAAALTIFSGAQYLIDGRSALSETGQLP